MKKILLSLQALVLCTLLMAQAPHTFNYQAVVRDAGGLPVLDRKVSVRFTIHDGSVNGPVAFIETQNATTNQFGLVTLAMGATGKGLESVNWAIGEKYLQVEMDINNKGTYTDMGTSQLLSVPYAFYAGQAGSVAANNEKTVSDDNVSWNCKTHTLTIDNQSVNVTNCDGTFGATGPTGPAGAAGAAGAKGATGATGPAGVAGPTGSTGAAGTPGVAGAKGATGSTGPQGPAGVTGPQGAAGPAGAQGVAGPAGAQGPQGVQGATGAQGIQGPIGPQGIAGTQGGQGAQGIPGPTGAQGNQGLAGTNGVQGPTGASGANGATGPQGLTGNNGTNGAQGPAGVTGPQGPTGNNGNDGSQGPAGAAGPQGPTGNNGAQGPSGVAGATGPQGPTGNNGNDGAPGINGATGPQGPAGVTGAQGPAGNNGVGVTGPTGPAGTGTSLPNGSAAGQILMWDGTQWVATTLCSIFGSDVNNCGSCGHVCSLPNATPTCNNGQCAILSCNPGFADCNGIASDGCEVNLNSDAANCSACGLVCSFPNASAACSGGGCVITGCIGGYADCDHIANNGCETNVANEVVNCGFCGFVCPAGPNSVAVCHGTCSIVCNTGFANCDGNPNDGCEIAVSSDPSNCGSCGQVCFAPGATVGCSNGICFIAECAAGYADCDRIFTDGCEVNVSGNVANCGACGFACIVANGTPNCLAGGCHIAGCNAGFADCDNNYNNGCETNVSTNLVNCGSCGYVCSAPNATSSCTGGGCTIASCNQGFKDCDQMYADGCEVNISSDVHNCGTCGNQCPVTQSCVGGSCH